MHQLLSQNGTLRTAVTTYPNLNAHSENITHLDLITSVFQWRCQIEFSNYYNYVDVSYLSIKIDDLLFRNPDRHRYYLYYRCIHQEVLSQEAIFKIK